MVENNEQWEDMEYSDNQEENVNNSDYEDEYSEDSANQEYDDSYEDYEDDEEESEGNRKKGNPLPLLLIFVILVGLIALILFLRSGAAKQHADNANSADTNSYVTNNLDSNSNGTEQSQEQVEGAADSFFENSQNESENSNMMSVNFNESGETNVTTGDGENQQVATVTESNNSNIAKESDLFDTQTQAAKSSDQENNAIMVVYNKAARTNPFKPIVTVAAEEKTPDFEILNNVPFEVIEPPKTSIVDENINRLLKTQISGILYDSVSPSAIVNLNGLDHFVKVGDTISGYTIKNITKDKVQISYKNNSYVASVGELFTPGNLEKQQAVANLENKFAGRYKN